MNKYNKPIFISEEIILEEVILFSGLVNNGIAGEIGSEGEKFGG